MFSTPKYLSTVFFLSAFSFTSHRYHSTIQCTHTTHTHFHSTSSTHNDLFSTNTIPIFIMKFSFLTLALAVSAFAMPHGDHSHQIEHQNKAVEAIKQDSSLVPHVSEHAPGAVDKPQDLDKVLADLLLSSYLKGEKGIIPADVLKAALNFHIVDHGHGELAYQDSGSVKNGSVVSVSATENNVDTGTTITVVKPVVDKTALTAEQLAAAFANTMTNKTMNGTAHGNTTAPGVPGDASKPNNAIAINAAFGAVFGGAVLAVIVGAL
ncbi:Protein of unknown function [Pyronema omphalodes CBS 100304]|uniref:Uncharacterized protein n=1 Tax=Pyronema omphalodes (strain CBS 100304) TaxID=1076935 RepID=U4LNI1_PYROM|nr:Protein of unknown function [Pyronema omphalodes CBS 100304]